MIRSTYAAALAFALLALPAALAGCDALDAQSEFEQEAFLPASGIARTDAQGTLLADDPDDWRTAPLYALSGFRVSQRPSPNPARIDQVVTTVVFTDEAIPGGLRIVGYRDALRAPIPGQRQERQDVPGPGAYVFAFFPAEIPGAQPGDLWRLVFFDGQSHVVTYGDLQIEG
jgi:hypothetical protein